ncbi:MAG: VWA domain-containing protein [Geminicoccaceae bacterium]
MLVDFFMTVREHRVPATIREWLDLLRALDAGLAHGSVDDFYLLARAALVKDESHYDRFDRAFAAYFKGVEALDEVFAEIPDDWLRAAFERSLSAAEKAEIEALGGFDKLMDALRDRLANQEERHRGGSKWIGTGGTSPFGAYGYNPEGVRIGQDRSRHRHAVKVWDKRDFRDLDSSRELGTRSIKMALRKLRRFAREGASEELDLEATIGSTARNAGLLDVHMRPERHNAVKVLMFFDVGGSMDDHVRQVEELFSAARSEFKHLEYYYFHNCLYDFVWRDNHRRFDERIPTFDLLHTYTSDYKVIIVGDATMSPYEIVHIGGANEYWNDEPGQVWLQRLYATFPKAVWLNPQPPQVWGYHTSIGILHRLISARMYPLNLEGLGQAIRALS